MNQLNWTYLADNGTRHTVGMMHGPTSGHLLVHCNSKIILIDFSILDEKSYSFFIEEELCELFIEKNNGEFSYRFETNAKVNTPLNQARKKLDRKHLYQSLAFMAALLMVVILAASSVLYLNKEQTLTLEQQLSTMGEETHARVIYSPDGKDKQVEYFFVVDGKPFTVETPYTEDSNPLLLGTGMPLEVGDEFVLKYLPNNPLLHKIAYDEPSQGTLERYRNRALDAYQNQFPEKTAAFSECLTEVAYEKEGIVGLAKIFFSNVQVSENQRFNKEVFQQWLASEDFSMAMSEKCGL